MDKIGYIAATLIGLAMFAHRNDEPKAAASYEPAPTVYAAVELAPAVTKPAPVPVIVEPMPLDPVPISIAPPDPQPETMRAWVYGYGWQDLEMRDGTWYNPASGNPITEWRDPPQQRTYTTTRRFGWRLRPRNWRVFRGGC